MIDKLRIQELGAEIGMDDLRFIVSVYLAEAEETIGKIAAGLPGDEQARAVHFLRSGALNIGLSGIAEVSEHMETAADVSIPGSIGALAETLTQTQTALRDVLHDPV